MEKIALDPTLVSIIVPTYNYGHLISETLDSICQQTYSNWECIIIDDGSTDNTSSIVKQYTDTDSRFIYISQKNAGTTEAKNSALKLVQGNFIQFLDADDLMPLRKIEKQVNYLLNNPEVDIIYSYALYFEHTNRELIYKSWKRDQEEWMPKCSGVAADIVPHVLIQNIMVIQAPLLRKHVIDKVGKFEVPCYMEDWDYWLRCAFMNFRFQFDHDWDTTCYVRLHESSALQNKQRGEMLIRSALDIRYRIFAMTADKNIHEINKTLYDYVKIELLENRNYLGYFERFKMLAVVIGQRKSPRLLLYSLLSLTLPLRVFKFLYRNLEKI